MQNGHDISIRVSVMWGGRTTVPAVYSVCPTGTVCQHPVEGPLNRVSRVYCRGLDIENIMVGIAARAQDAAGDAQGEHAAYLIS